MRGAPRTAASRAPAPAARVLGGIPRAGTAPDDRAWAFLNRRYRLLAERRTMLQGEREQWIRLSVLATFGFFGWIAQYARETAMSLMLGATQVRLIYVFPFVFTAGGALRFFFIQRDIDRLVGRQMAMEMTPSASRPSFGARPTAPACATATGTRRPSPAGSSSSGSAAWSASSSFSALEGSE